MRQRSDYERNNSEAEPCHKRPRPFPLSLATGNPWLLWSCLHQGRAGRGQEVHDDINPVFNGILAKGFFPNPSGMRTHRVKTELSSSSSSVTYQLCAFGHITYTSGPQFPCCKIVQVDASLAWFCETKTRSHV